MEPAHSSGTRGQRGVIDAATLYLCRQGPRWVVVIESPRVSRAVRLRHAGRDPYDARFELLNAARRACPDASIFCTDGAIESADYEWRLEMRGVEGQPGDLGVALHEVLAAEPPHLARSAQQQTGRRCHWGLSPVVSGRPRAF